VRNKASCCAIGRSSLDATNACLMRAVRAARAACPGRATRRDRALPFFAAGDVLELFLCVVAAVLLAGFAGSAEFCALTGDTAIKMANIPETQRAERSVKFGDFATLMSPLYAGFASRTMPNRKPGPSCTRVGTPIPCSRILASASIC
jgi:hypothetical protein